MNRRHGIPSLLVFFLCSAVRVLHADTTTVNLESGDQAVYDQNTAAMNPLSGGTSANGDGDVLQLGYYSNATVANNFAGTWIPLTGETSPNTATIPNSGGEKFNQTSIGDITQNGGANATFFISNLNFIAGDATSGNNLPPSSAIPLALRFYNNTSIATSTYYNVVSDDLWVWKAPATPPSIVNVSLNDVHLEWLSEAMGQTMNTDFHTTIPLQSVPEPATWGVALLAGGFIAFGTLRRLRRPV